MEYTCKFKEISGKDIDIAGGKGASLGEMEKAGLPVPAGYVVTTQAFEQFLDFNNIRNKIDSRLEEAKTEDKEVEDVSEQIQSLILDSKIPGDIKKEIKISLEELETERVAVRSSATSEDSSSDSWAGQLETFLEVSEEQLVEKIKKCWASLFSPRAIFYRKKKLGQEETLSMAVVVQEMLEADISGVAFSADPESGDRDRIRIEAAYGLGEAVVSGKVTPDSYIVEKESRTILDKGLSEQDKGLSPTDAGTEWKDIEGKKGHKQVLSDSQIFALSDIVQNIEEHHNGKPQDIEWVLEGGEFYIVQSRPITTLDSSGHIMSVVKNHKWLYLADREAPLLFNSLFITSYQEFFPSYGKPSIGRLLSDHTLLVQEKDKASLSAYRYPSLAKKSGEKVQEWIGEEPEVLQELHKRTLEEKKRIEERIPEIKSRTLEEQYRQLSQCYIDFFSLQVLPLFIERSFRDNAEELIEHRDILVEWREEVHEFNADLENRLEDIVEGLSEKYGEDLSRYSHKELMEFLDSDETIDTSDRDNFVMLWCFGREPPYILEEGEEAENIMRELDSRTVEKEKEPGLEGMGIGNGVVEGKCNIIESKKELEDVERDEIVVAKVLEVEDLRILKGKDITAMVTEEGGLTSHVAISADELGIPAVIGVKKITEKLTDGEMLEVDADAGTITALDKD